MLPLTAGSALQVTAKCPPGAHYQGAPRLYCSAQEVGLACNDNRLSRGTRCPVELLGTWAAELACSAVSDLCGMLHVHVARLKSS